MRGSTSKPCSSAIADVIADPQALPQLVLTRHEVGWIEFLRLASNDSDPAPTLARVQALQRILSA